MLAAVTVRLTAAFLGLGLAMAACGVPAAPPPARLWTLDDYAALYEGRGDAQNIPPLPDVTPAGKLLEYLGAGHYRLVMQPTFEEKYPAAYVTTALWQGFDEDWVKPRYL